MDDDDPFAPPGLEGELSLSVVNMLEMMDARIEKQLCEERERAAAEEASRLTRTEVSRPTAADANTAAGDGEIGCLPPRPLLLRAPPLRGVAFPALPLQVDRQ